MSNDKQNSKFVFWIIEFRKLDGETDKCSAMPHTYLIPQLV